jgi:tRNA (guanine-N7-)-methyltransferase
MKPFYVSLKPFLDYRPLAHPTAWPAIFGNDQPLEVEIGFGNGEYLAKVAEGRQAVNFVGFEEYCERIHKTLRKLSRVPNGNVRVLRMDVRPAFHYLFAPSSISYIHCLYPPPWPKKSDAKHRLFTPDFLKLTNNRLITSGVLKIVTDHYPYIEWVQEQLPGTGFAIELKRIAASYDTKFERKWVEGGQKEFFELLLTKKESIDVPVKKEVPLKHYILDDFDPEQFRFKEYSQEGIAVIFRDILYDASRKTALIHLLVNDEHIFQNIRIAVVQTSEGWRVSLAEGSMMMPTAGIAKALDLVYEAALTSVVKS